MKVLSTLHVSGGGDGEVPQVLVPSALFPGGRFGSKAVSVRES